MINTIKPFLALRRIIYLVVEIFEEEYNHINLWYFFSFFCGIIYFFTERKIPKEIIFLGSLASLALIILSFYHKSHVLISFLCGISVFFILGIGVAQIRWNSIINTDTKKRVISGSIIGTISDIKKKNTHITLILKDVFVLKNKYSHNKILEKVKMNLSNDHVGDVVLNLNDRVEIKSILYTTHKNYNFLHNYNNFYSYVLGIEAFGYSKDNVKKLFSLKNNMSSYINNIIYKIRKSIENRLCLAMKAEYAQVAIALLIGKIDSMENKLLQSVRDIGVGHIFCVSGLHISTVAGFVFTTFRVLLNLSNKISYKANIKICSLVISIMFTFFYLLITGSGIASIRAFLMFSFFVLAIFLNRHILQMRSVLGVAFIMLSFQPEIIMHPSFQLSFASVICIIGGYQYYQSLQIKILPFLEKKNIISNFAKYIVVNIYTTFLASILTIPFAIYHFFQFPTYSIISNLLAVPLITLFIIPLLILSLLFMSFNLEMIFLKLSSFFIYLFLESVRLISTFPYVSIVTGHISHYSLFLFVLGIFWLLIWQGRVKFLAIAIMIFGIHYMYLGKKADLIYLSEDQIILMRDGNSATLFHFNQNINDKAIQRLQNWYGKKITQVKYLSIEDNNIISLNNDLLERVSINYDKCYHEDDVALQMVFSEKLDCQLSENFIVPFQFLVKSPIIYIYCKQGKCSYK